MIVALPGLFSYSFFFNSVHFAGYVETVAVNTSAIVIIAGRAIKTCD